MKRVLPDQKWQDAIVNAATLFERDVTSLIRQYEAAAEGRPMTERRPDYNTVELKLA